MTGFNWGGPVSARDNAVMSNPIMTAFIKIMGGALCFLQSVGVVKARTGVLVYAGKQYCEAGHEVH